MTSAQSEPNLTWRPCEVSAFDDISIHTKSPGTTRNAEPGNLGKNLQATLWLCVSMHGTWNIGNRVDQVKPESRILFTVKTWPYMWDTQRIKYLTSYIVYYILGYWPHRSAALLQNTHSK